MLRSGSGDSLKRELRIAGRLRLSAYNFDQMRSFDRYGNRDCASAFAP